MYFAFSLSFFQREGCPKDRVSLYFYLYPVQDIQQILKQYWGFDQFRPLQREIIEAVLRKEDTLALLPTGGGKSICFQVPAMAGEGLCLVVSPLIALMKDQVQNLTQRGIKAAALYSGMTYRQIDTMLDSCIYGDYKFLYVSPERLAGEEFQVRMQKMNISLLAVDEAHCISQWGYDFRPPYMKIADIREKLKGVPVIALTATATPQVVNDIQEKLLFKKKHVVQQSFVRKNLSYVVRQSRNKEQSLLDILTKVKGSAIVYARSRKKTKEFSDYLNKQGIKSDYYHAGLDPLVRSEKQDNWISNKTRVICSTNAFGMGIDKADVGLVIHMDLAESLEAYFQEAGRAGRDEKKAYAVQLTDSFDLSFLDKKIEESFPSTELVKDVYQNLSTYLRIAYNSGINNSFDFDLRAFSEHCKLHQTKAYSALKILEQQGIIYMAEGVSNSSMVKAIAAKDVIYKFQTDHKKYEALIKFILRTSEGVFMDFVPLEENIVASRLKISVHQTAEQLQALHQMKIINYQPRKENAQIVFLQNRVKREDLWLDTVFIKSRKESFEEKLKAVKYYVTENHICRTKLLVKYFGETVEEDCGICDVCTSLKKTSLSTAGFSEIVAALENELKQSALTGVQIKTRLQIKDADFDKAINFLLDAGKITWADELNLKWVD